MKLSKVIFIILIISNIIGVSFVAVNRYNELIQDEQDTLKVYATRLKHAVEAEIMITNLIKEIVLISGGTLREAEFHKIGKVIASSLVKSSITYIPNGIIEYVYPPDISEGIVGRNIFEDKSTAPDSIKARDTKKIVIQGPYKLFEGNFGIVIRNPVYYKDDFWGLVAVAIDSEDLFNYVGLELLAQQGYEFRLTTPNTLAAESDDYGMESAISTDVTIGGSNWTLGLYVKDKTNIIITDAMFWFLIFLFINFILYYLLQRFERSRDNLAKKLETDSLTGAGNRLKLHKYYEELQDRPFALFFVDLNKFKPVNDNHGHKVGDKLLKDYVGRLKNEMMADTLIARVGGDEFVVITPNVVDDDRATKIKLKLLNLSEIEFPIEGLRIKISASIGYTLSSEANTLDALLARADEKMYAEKASKTR